MSRLHEPPVDFPRDLCTYPLELGGCGLGIARISVGVMCQGQSTVGGVDLLLGCRLGDLQLLVVIESCDVRHLGAPAGRIVELKKKNLDRQQSHRSTTTFVRVQVLMLEGFPEGCWDNTNCICCFLVWKKPEFRML